MEFIVLMCVICAAVIAPILFALYIFLKKDGYFIGFSITFLIGSFYFIFFLMSHSNNHFIFLCIIPAVVLGLSYYLLRGYKLKAESRIILLFCIAFSYVIFLFYNLYFSNLTVNSGVERSVIHLMSAITYLLFSFLYTYLAIKENSKIFAVYSLFILMVFPLFLMFVDVIYPIMRIYLSWTLYALSLLIFVFKGIILFLSKNGKYKELFSFTGIILSFVLMAIIPLIQLEYKKIWDGYINVQGYIFAGTIAAMLIVCYFCVKMNKLLKIVVGYLIPSFLYWTLMLASKKFGNFISFDISLMKWSFIITIVFLLLSLIMKFRHNNLSCYFQEVSVFISVINVISAVIIYFMGGYNYLDYWWYYLIIMVAAAYFSYLNKRKHDIYKYIATVFINIVLLSLFGMINSSLTVTNDIAAIFLKDIQLFIFPLTAFFTALYCYKRPLNGLGKIYLSLNVILAIITAVQVKSIVEAIVVIIIFYMIYFLTSAKRNVFVNVIAIISVAICSLAYSYISRDDNLILFLTSMNLAIIILIQLLNKKDYLLTGILWHLLVAKYLLLILYINFVYNRDDFVLQIIITLIFISIMLFDYYKVKNNIFKSLVIINLVSGIFIFYASHSIGLNLNRYAMADKFFIMNLVYIIPLLVYQLAIDSKNDKHTKLMIIISKYVVLIPYIFYALFDNNFIFKIVVTVFLPVLFIVDYYESYEHTRKLIFKAAAAGSILLPYYVILNHNCNLIPISFMPMSIMFPLFILTIYITRKVVLKYNKQANINTLEYFAQAVIYGILVTMARSFGGSGDVLFGFSVLTIITAIHLRYNAVFVGSIILFIIVLIIQFCNILEDYGTHFWEIIFYMIATILLAIVSILNAINRGNIHNIKQFCLKYFNVIKAWDDKDNSLIVSEETIVDNNKTIKDENDERFTI